MSAENELFIDPKDGKNKSSTSSISRTFNSWRCTGASAGQRPFNNSRTNDNACCTKPENHDPRRNSFRTAYYLQAEQNIQARCYSRNDTRRATETKTKTSTSTTQPNSKTETLFKHKAASMSKTRHRCPQNSNQTLKKLD